MTTIQKHLLTQDAATGAPLPFPPATRLEMLGFLMPDKKVFPTPVQIVAEYRQAFTLDGQGRVQEIPRSEDGTLSLPLVQIQAPEGAKVSPGEIAFAINRDLVLVDPPVLLKHKLAKLLKSSTLTDAEETSVRQYLDQDLPQIPQGMFGHAWHDLTGFIVPDNSPLPGPVMMVATRTTPYILNNRGEAYRPAPDRTGRIMQPDISPPAEGLTVQVGTRAYALSREKVLWGSPQELGKTMVAQAPAAVTAAYRTDNRAHSALARAFFRQSVPKPVKPAKAPPAAANTRPPGRTVAAAGSAIHPSC